MNEVAFLVREFAEPLDGPVRYAVLESPVGPLLLTGDGRSVTGLYTSGQRYGPRIGADWVPDPGLLPPVRDQLAAYFAGELRRFDLPLAPCGTPWQRQVWQALTTVPYGRTTTYGALAVALGRPTAARAVGLANGRNPVSVVIPCHRVVGADGSLTGYAGGLARKRRLLELESGALPLG
ncbi:MULTISPECIES: methylated-DNA--[protein]-cysteine S-methyltransferase [Streptomycetaceae]|uniref:Methylated-DNA--protein-cysteine methyltransferase n=1 Tax=Streptantibioticus cattleyicolor (strain ATCC 35852 / DSM 46488 / JCM 4925 / NBRC 14057 / NRRL 8057) TaxID=1003195 RepID=F8K3E6_STREN|nr:MULTISPECIES: methylated-DNA--[protein]-cysteine S-methyltransferase [Streptomycetaceae]AEW95063.1 O-6-methylguanine DNA methyltransferase [Streptantibioticus cattleyicolor NRRL 8057 = DSM 46488]MYS59659.1 methylated-DNA--[protein]-cysteine S-methyltransferase [Streptomyces sp. SID5468]CCB75413.1 Methylated-DNA--protein-cysteine methyltransferase [Streptantibioticus cattleyicolor NRRL 8057 = DSM 46488]